MIDISTTRAPFANLKHCSPIYSFPGTSTDPWFGLTQAILAFTAFFPWCKFSPTTNSYINNHLKPLKSFWDLTSLLCCCLDFVWPSVGHPSPSQVKSLPFWWVCCGDDRFVTVTSHVFAIVTVTFDTEDHRNITRNCYVSYFVSLEYWPQLLHPINFFGQSRNYVQDHKI